MVEEKILSGWDDPRMPTLSGMRKRGYPAEAIKAFCASVGVSKANSEVDSQLLEFHVRDYLNNKADRAMVVEKPLKVVIDNFDGDTEFVIGHNPEDEAAVHKIKFGREIYIERSDFEVIPPPKYHRLTIGGMVRLKGAYILTYASHETDSKGEVTCVHCTYIEDSQSGGVNNGIKVKGVIHWVHAASAVPATLYKYASLLTDETDEKKNFDDRINPDSLEVVEGALCESWLNICKEDSAFQFVRSAYYKKASKVGEPLKFYRIVELKDTFNAKK
jgi:glutaminyl-tRNA synthetase